MWKDGEQALFICEWDYSYNKNAFKDQRLSKHSIHKYWLISWSFLRRTRSMSFWALHRLMEGRSIWLLLRTQSVRSPRGCLLLYCNTVTTALTLAFTDLLVTFSAFAEYPLHRQWTAPGVYHTLSFLPNVRGRDRWHDKCPRQEVPLKNKAMMMLYEFYRDGKKFYICFVPEAGCNFSVEWNCVWEVIDPDFYQACSKAKVTNDVVLEVGEKIFAVMVGGPN